MKIFEVMRQIAPNAKRILLPYQIGIAIAGPQIEAAQSGETGARFSVVAAEIRELSKETILPARKAETAAREIQDLLSAIVISSESESVKVLSSVHTVKVINKNIEELMAQIDNNYSFIRKIDVSIKQQESGSKEAADTLHQMANVALRSAETARQTAQAVQDIVLISSELDTVVKTIRVEGG